MCGRLGEGRRLCSGLPSLKFRDDILLHMVSISQVGKEKGGGGYLRRVEIWEERILVEWEIRLPVGFPSPMDKQFSSKPFSSHDHHKRTV